MMTTHQINRLLRTVAVMALLALAAAACGSSGNDTISLSNDTGNEPGSGAAAGADVEGDVAEYEYVDFDERTHASSEQLGRPVVVNFFASWCPTCIAEMPDFEAVHLAVKDDVDFLGLAMQDRKEAALALIDETGISYATGIDDGSLLQQFGGLGMPTTVFIDADGVIRNVHTGVLDVDSLTDMIDEHLRSDSDN